LVIFCKLDSEFLSTDIFFVFGSWDRFISNKRNTMKHKILFFILSNILFLNANGQSNDYFTHNESWSSVHYDPLGGSASYVFQVGDTVINNDTLIKLKEPNAQFGMTPDTNFFLAKSNLGKLYIYYSNTNFNNIGDSIIYDFSRTDSITSISYNNSQSIYSGSQISSIDTIYFGSVGRKIFNIVDVGCGTNNNDYVYEGVFGYYDACFEYANFLTCYSIFDTTYYVNLNTFAFNSSGTCTMSNLGINELNSENKKLIKMIDLMGRETLEYPNNIYIYIYDDGSTKKVVRIE
jgi:hypothetical protein